MCTIINLLEQYCLDLITFCTYLERSSDFEFAAIQNFYVTVFKCKWVSEVDTYEAVIVADSMIWKVFATHLFTNIYFIRTGSERSVQFFLNYFFNLFLEVSQIRTILTKMGKK